MFNIPGLNKAFIFLKSFCKFNLKKGRKTHANKLKKKKRKKIHEVIDCLLTCVQFVKHSKC